MTEEQEKEFIEIATKLKMWHQDSGSYFGIYDPVMDRLVKLLDEVEENRKSTSDGIHAGDRFLKYKMYEKVHMVYASPEALKKLKFNINKGKHLKEEGRLT